MSPRPRIAEPSSRDRGRVDRLIRQLETVRGRLRAIEERVPLERFGASEESARNLLHYVALRRFDLRSVQDRLADLGLSSLGRAESHVLYNLDSILARLRALRGIPAITAGPVGAIDPERGRRRLARNATHLFGRPRPGRDTRIMVTLPTEAASDPEFVRRLLVNGADCARINCAHDSPEAWLAMIGNVRRAARDLRQACRIEMDLGGPRLRIGPIAPGPAVLKVRPPRDPLGRALRPALVRLSASASPPPAARATDAELVVPAEWLGRRRLHERIGIEDARGSRRELRIVALARDQAIASLAKAAYLTNGLALEGRARGGRPDRAVLGKIPAREGRIRLAPGDRLTLTGDLAPGHDRGPGQGPRASAATVGVTIPQVLDQLAVGHHVWFDGGRIGGVVRSCASRMVTIEVEHAPPDGTWLRGDQGINLPDTELTLPPMTSQDRQDLPFIARHADLVGYSFVQSPEDVEMLRAELQRLGRPKMGIVVKIETRRAFDSLPAILLAALRAAPAGVMVARGDLAVEVGFERLAEVQEEMLWLCEAAHLPAIWATQVLEGLAKSGIPSRAEVTDAAMGERAECVMLNKGPYLIPAVRALDSIIRRMQAHQAKKSARLRHLSVAERFLAAGPAS